MGQEEFHASKPDLPNYRQEATIIVQINSHHKL